MNYCILKKIVLSTLLFPLVSCAGDKHVDHNVENYVVYHNKSEFAGWPANEGLWQWDNEVLTAFEVATFVETEGDHSIDRNSPKRIVFARSMDGGRTWTTEEHEEILPPAYLGDETLYQQASAASAPKQYLGGYDFESPDFAMKLRGKNFYVSNDRGHNWEGPFLLPEYGYTSEARTSYIVTGKDSMLLFMTGRINNNGLRYGRSLVLETNNGGKTFEFVSWIGEDFEPELSAAERENGTLFSIMPSAVELGEGHYVVSVRQRAHRRKWTDIFETKDNCRTWEKISLLEKGSSNPATLVVLNNGDLAAVYGSRRQSPTEVVAKISKDKGHTWSKEIVLRNDGRKWDIGYSRATVLPGGDVLGIYYFTTDEMPENFIGATRWTPALLSE
ncbi:sialidase family protein [Coraliomargarita sp. SDUM461004]|uniref:Sialidase family protein n=1 Tax=Thalassobacterium sedimentorum TaxID=3041258 RepID=A0ABU1AJE0_9BACT|nr:sialidase family protein [Coraliomargarita sp. SDUM461004]MDQ8194937.1 sialidase family protein [Coraliomargarita sp. SDUM461004]